MTMVCLCWKTGPVLLEMKVLYHLTSVRASARRMYNNHRQNTYKFQGNLMQTHVKTHQTLLIIQFLIKLKTCQNSMLKMRCKKILTCYLKKEKKEAKILSKLNLIIMGNHTLRLWLMELIQVMDRWIRSQHPKSKNNKNLLN